MFTKLSKFNTYQYVFIFLLPFILGVHPHLAHANDGHRIEINIKNYTADYCFFTGY